MKKKSKLSVLILLMLVMIISFALNASAEALNLRALLLKDNLDNYDVSKTAELVGNFKSPTSRSEYVDFEDGKAYQITADGTALQFMSIVAGFGAGENPDWSADAPKGIAFRLVTFDKPIGLFPRVNVSESVGTGIDPASGNVALYDTDGNRVEVKEYELETVGILVPAQFDGYFVVRFDDAFFTNSAINSIDELKFTNMVSLVLYMCNGEDISSELKSVKFIIDDIYCLIDPPVEPSPSPSPSIEPSVEPSIVPSPSPSLSPSPSPIPSPSPSPAPEQGGSIIGWSIIGALLILFVVAFFIFKIRYSHKRETE